MGDYVETALLVYEPAAGKLVQAVMENSHACSVATLSLQQLFADPAAGLAGVEHVVVAAGLPDIKRVLQLSMEHGFSVGIVPVSRQGKLARYLDLPSRQSELIALALESDAAPMDIVLCNGHIMLFRGSIGWIPMLDASESISQLRRTLRSLRKFLGLRLLAFNITTSGGNTIRTAASGEGLCRSETARLSVLSLCPLARGRVPGRIR